MRNQFNFINMDLRESFITINRDELTELQNKIKKLCHENEKLIAKNQMLTFEIKQMKSIVPKNGLKTEHSSHINCGTTDQNSTVDFVQRQGYANSTTNACILTNISDNIRNGNLQNGLLPNILSNNQIIVVESPDSLPIIGYEINRNSNVDRNIENKYVQNQHNLDLSEDNSYNYSQNNLMTSNLFHININRKLLSIEKEFKQSNNAKTIIKLIIKEWIERPPNTTRTEFFYHLIGILIENGISINYCTEHSPPCKPRVNYKKFEKLSGEVLKSFIKSINRSKQLVIEVELLVALENFIYIEPKFRPALSDILDILFRTGVAEAAAFGQWSEIELREQKRCLIREVKSSGFTLIKRHSI